MTGEIVRDRDVFSVVISHSIKRDLEFKLKLDIKNIKTEKMF